MNCVTSFWRFFSHLIHKYMPKFCEIYSYRINQLQNISCRLWSILYVFMTLINVSFASYFKRYSREEANTIAMLINELYMLFCEQTQMSIEGKVLTKAIDFIICLLNFSNAIFEINIAFSSERLFEIIKKHLEIVYRFYCNNI